MDWAKPCSAGGTAPPSALPGHLPRKGGDWVSGMPSPISNIEKLALSATLPISLLAGEMAGRPEGGVKDRDASDLRS
ncbi:MAG: hypothetical protein E5Y12_11935 [Mesorhizobium sp.]|nr:MAG: hypothetical protein E5Y12_11935 [Mesorhizobium sp.]